MNGRDKQQLLPTICDVSRETIIRFSADGHSSAPVTLVPPAMTITVLQYGKCVMQM